MANIGLLISDTKYICDFKECGKSFSRSDHLTRHQLNHGNVKRKCTWPNCGKLFTRQDVYKKHYKDKHENSLMSSQVLKEEKPLKFVYMNKDKKMKLEKEIPGESNYQLHKVDLNNYQENTYTNESLPFKVDAPTTTGFPSELGSPTFKEVDRDKQGAQDIDFTVQDVVSSNEMIKWLFGGMDSNVSETSSLADCLSVSPDGEIFPELGAFEYPSPTIHMTAHDATPGVVGFPFSNSQTVIDNGIRQKLVAYLPIIETQTNSKLHDYLENYWMFYHHQFPILNYPSFSTKSSHPILLLAMILLGSFISGTSKRDTLKFADSIAEPLRLVIYQFKDFKPPPKLWIVQSLLLLECYEISCSSRDLHERANLHRGISIQLLKRSPMFGGNPWHSSTDDTINESVLPFSSKESWQTWINEESMKRCAFATFYLEVLHAVIFGHDMNIGLYEVKPMLPCNEEFWKTGILPEKELNDNFTLLSAIKSILHRKPIKVHGFGKSILLSGLIALSFEIKDREFEFFLPELQSMKQFWKNRINDAFKVWDLNYSPTITEKIWLETYSIPLRELFESYTHIKHYDFMVYVGAPGRMNVSISEKEFEVVTSRVVDWVNSGSGQRAIVFIYSYFCRLLFDNDKPLVYNPKEDKCLYRKQTILHMLVILWCWCYCSSGPESHSLKWVSTHHHVSNIEDGHSYLARINRELSILANKAFTKENVNKNINIFANVLPLVPGKQNIVGLLRLFRSQYIDDPSAIAREHAKLLDHCMNRSLGSPKKVCDDMFE